MITYQLFDCEIRHNGGFLCRVTLHTEPLIGDFLELPFDEEHSMIDRCNEFKIVKRTFVAPRGTQSDIKLTVELVE